MLHGSAEGAARVVSAPDLEFAGSGDGLAQYLDTVRATRAARAITARPQGAPVPVSPEQRNLLLHAAIAGNGPLYNESITLHRREPLDRGALERSFAELLRRHEIWRTGFVEVEGEWRQIVHSECRLEIPYDDLSALPETEQEQIARALAMEDAQKLFDLARPPLLRARLIRFGAETYRLYLALHHIIFDGVTIYRILLPELAALYRAHAADETPDLPRPSLHYGDYALWRAKGPPDERQVQYWRRQLADFDRPLRLPMDRPRPAQPSGRGGVEAFAISQPLSLALKALARESGASLYAALLAAFKTLLHRYSGQDDIIIGGIADTRCRPELTDMAGYFLNSLALRSHPTGQTRFRTFLGQVQSLVLDALDNAQLPFDQVVRDGKFSREAGAHPLFQVAFSFQPPPPSADYGWDLTGMDVAPGCAKFDLYVEMEERRDGLAGRIFYSLDLFDPSRIRRMVGHWMTLLEAIAAAPDTPLARLAILTRNELAALARINATRREIRSGTLPDWFEAQARLSPEAIALECGGVTLSYRDLNRRAMQIATRLRAAGAKHQDLIAVLLDRSSDLVAGLLAVLRLGCAYLPLDPELPRTRLERLLEEAGPPLLLTDQHLCGRIPGEQARIVLCDGGDLADGPPPVPETPMPSPGDLAYVLFTSGSSGRPKAVEISHRALANLLESFRAAPGFESADAMFAVTTLSFDIAALEIFLPLISGGRLVLATRDELSDPGLLTARLTASNATMMQGTPSLWRQLVANDWPGLPHLTLLCGGEALDRDLADRLLERGRALYNVYGPTETTIWSLMAQVCAEQGPVPIGGPIANTLVYILDRNGELVPEGIEGELHIGGAGLARGYRHDPALTASQFAIRPAVPGTLLYRTGDRARMRPDGRIDFLGRIDNQVKIRGFRVGLEEIECEIAAHPGIAACALRAFPDASGALALHAFIVPRRPGEMADLASHLRERLPAYMVPSHFIHVDELPMTPNGKVDRRRLEKPMESDAPKFIEPADALEGELASIWCALLGLKKVGREDNFFELGGHSLLAATMIAEIRKRLGRHLLLPALFRAPTIKALADLIRSGPDQEFSYVVPLRQGGAGRPLFIVHAVYGNVLEFRALAERLDTDRPIYAIQARGADLRNKPHATIAEMAETYIAAIRRIQPAGPYALSGYSFGGLIAFEMASRLFEANETVDLLGLIETDVLDHDLTFFERSAFWALSQWASVCRGARRLRCMTPEEWPPYLLSKVEKACKWVSRRSHPTALEARNLEMRALYLAEFLRYRARRYPGRIALFRTNEISATDPLPVWRSVADRLELYMITGLHGGIMREPDVENLALRFNDWLADADGKTTATTAFQAAPDGETWSASSPCGACRQELDAQSGKL